MEYFTRITRTWSVKMKFVFHFAAVFCTIKRDSSECATAADAPTTNGIQTLYVSIAHAAGSVQSQGRCLWTGLTVRMQLLMSYHHGRYLLHLQTDITSTFWLKRNNIDTRCIKRFIIAPPITKLHEFAIVSVNEQYFSRSSCELGKRIHVGKLI